MNQKNKRHVDKVWGKCGKVHVWITRIVDDYNHWICGVDLADQKISYYHPYLPCHRTWVPMFIQFLYMIRLKSYICYVSHYKTNKHYKPIITHKDFRWRLSNIC